MKWLSALLLGAILGVVLPTALDMRSGVWMNSFASWGTIHPHAGSPDSCSRSQYSWAPRSSFARFSIGTRAEAKGLPERIPLIRVTAMPADTNPYGGVFGGWLMGQMGLACGSFVSRRTRGKALLVAADAIKFPGAMAVGDELSVYVDLIKQGRTSLRIKAEALARERDGRRKRS